MAMTRRTMLALGLAALSSACPKPAASDGGVDASMDSGSPPTCLGVPLIGELPVDSDGRTVTIGCNQVSLRVSVVDDRVLRLTYLTSDAGARASYAVVGAPSPTVHPRFASTTSSAYVCTGELLLRIDRDRCRVRAEQADGAVLLDDADGGYFETASARGLTHAIAQDEHFYGFGERTGPLDKRGTAMTFWNTDAFQSAFGGYPPDADPLYQSIPFFIGLRGTTAYGLFIDDTYRLDFDLGKRDATTATFSAAGGVIDQYLIAGPAISDVVERYTQLTGRTPMPPRWTLGYHQSRWGYFPDTAVTAIADELRARKIPSDALWLDIQHLDGFRSFTWNPTGFANPSQLVSELATKGFKTVAIVDPGLKVDPSWDVYAQGLDGGYFLSQNGAPYIGEVWPGPAAFPDFSSPATRQWWGSLVPRTLDAGVRGLWIDMNEPANMLAGAGGTVPDSLQAAGDGTPTTMAEIHNVYALEEARATWGGMRAARPDTRPFILTRAGYAGIQRYAAVWTGDAPSTFATLQTTLPMLLGLGLSGVPLVGSDVGGYSGNPSPELFARWMELGALSPFFRDHVQTSAPPQEPWRFGTEAEDISRAVIDERYRLLPYLYSLVDEAARTGAPVLRPLVYEFQSEEITHGRGDEAMLGPFLLVAPVLEPGASARDVLLPSGRWFEYFSGAAIDGPATIHPAVTLGALPLYVREGAILPRGPVMQWSDQAPLAPLSLELYPSATASQFTLYEDDGTSLNGPSSRVTYSLRRTATGATLVIGSRQGGFVPTPRRLELRIRRVDHGVTAVRLGGVALPMFGTYDSLAVAGSGAFYDAADLSLVVMTNDQAGVTLEADYDPSLSSLAPVVLMPVQVTVPAGTPTTAPICISTSANGWTQQALTWDPGMTTASGLVPVPRGEWFFYKYTRGDWATVEKWPGCVEAGNRYELGKAHPVKLDTVWKWADHCP